MEIIQIYSIQQLCEKNQSQLISKLDTSSFNEINCIATHLQSNILTIETFLQKLNNISLITTINLSQSVAMRIFISLIDYSMVKINKQDKNMLIRYALKINQKSRNFRLLIHPISKDILISANLILPQELLHTQPLQDIILSLFQGFKLQQLNLYQHLLQFLFPIYFRQAELFQKNCQLLKRSIQTAPFYAWNMLRTTTKSKTHKQKKKYEQIRNEFLFQKKLVFAEDAVIKEICKLLNVDMSKKIESHHNFQYQQEIILKQKYLANLNFNMQSKLVNQITLSQENFTKLLNQKLTKIQSYQTGKILINATKFPNSKIVALNYQREILKRLPNFEFMGLPKYYLIKNYKQQTLNYTITNLYHGIAYYEFLQKNTQSITIFSKIHILHQILLILKYLSRYEIVYHNLDPKNLIVRKNLFVKAKDFTNAYNSNLKLVHENQQWLPWQNIFPYVSNYQKNLNLSYGDQKSDIFSFGMILYQTFYGTTPYFKKRNLKQQEYNSTQLLKPPVIGIQKQKNILNSLFSILIYASLESIRYDQPAKSTYIDIEQDCKNLSIKSRPHIDWMVVILKIIIQSTSEIFF